jgi:hypothetical protein
VSSCAPHRSRRHRRTLRRRYGCFQLPAVKGAKTIKKARAHVAWLARTDPKAKEVEFSEAWAHLSVEGRRYIVLHERAHLLTGPDHTPRFFEALKRLADANGIDWRTAWELEAWNCHRKN